MKINVAAARWLVCSLVVSTLIVVVGFHPAVRQLWTTVRPNPAPANGPLPPSVEQSLNEVSRLNSRRYLEHRPQYFPPEPEKVAERDAESETPSKDR